jgi:hypothetical protein
MKYVYELINDKGIVEYVGESINPLDRFYQHTKKKFRPKRGMGRFYGREDISLNILKGFDNHREAYEYQLELQNKYFGTNEREIAKLNGMKGKEFGHLGWPERRKRAGILQS